MVRYWSFLVSRYCWSCGTHKHNLQQLINGTTEQQALNSMNPTPDYRGLHNVCLHIVIELSQATPQQQDVDAPYQLAVLLPMGGAW